MKTRCLHVVLDCHLEYEQISETVAYVLIADIVWGAHLNGIVKGVQGWTKIMLGYLGSPFEDEQIKVLFFGECSITDSDNIGIIF